MFIRILCVVSALIAIQIALAVDYKVYDPQKYNADLSSDVNERILFIVDYSNSMNETINGVKKIDLALKSISRILSKVPDKTWIGLRVYGHRSSFNPITSCTASDMVVPIGPKNQMKIESSLYQMKPIGWTPITYSLKEAVRSDFTGFENKKRIILLTDGGENCDESPCEYAVNLMKIRDDISIDVIAFDLDDKEAKDQLICTALVTSGKFYTAKTQAQLVKSLEESFNLKKEVSGTIILPD